MNPNLLGVMGCYSKGQLDSAVMIRFIDQDKDGQLHYKAQGVDFSACIRSTSDVVDALFIIDKA